MSEFRNALFLATALASAPVIATAGEVSLSGEGLVRYEPDSARLQFTVTAEHTNPARASEQVSGIMADWRKAIQPHRGQLEDYSDADISVYTRSVPAREKGAKPENLSVARQTVSFSISDLALINPLLAEANSLGLQYHLGASQFYHSREQELEQQALGRAIADARSRCEFVASQLDKECGDIKTLNVNGGHRPVPLMMAEAKMGGDAVSSVGPREIRASVHAVFELD